MSDQKLRIEIETAATGNGAANTARDVANVASAAQKAAPAMQQAAQGSKAMADGLGKSVAVGSATTQLLQNLGQVGQGGAAGMFAAGRSIIAFGQVVRAVLVSTGPIGIAIATLGLLVAAVVALKDAFKPAGESAEEMAKRLAELNKAKLDRVAQEQKTLTEATNEAVEAIGKELTAMDKLADMKTARLIEEEKLRGKTQGLPQEVTDRNITRIRRDAEDAKIGRELSAADKTARVLEDAASEAERKRAMADVQRNQLLGLKATYDQLTKQEAEMRKEMLKGYFKRGYALPEDNAKLSALQKDMKQAEAALNKRLGGKDEDGKLYEDAQKTADEAYRNLSEAAQTAAKAAEAAALAAAEARALEGQIKPERTGLRAAEDKNAKPETEAEKAKREAAQQKAAEVAAYKAAQLSPQQWAGRIASGMVDDTQMEALKKVYPTYKFPAAPASTPSIASTPSTPGGVYRPGEALPTNTTGVYRAGERLPGSTLGAGNQMTRGKLQPGSDNKQFQQSAEQINESMTKAAEQEVPDLQPAAEAAEKLVTKGEELAASLQQTGDSVVQSLGAVATQQGQLVAVQGNQQGQIAQILAKIRAHDAAIASLRQRSQAA